MEHYALVTGATSGLGLAYAKWFAGKGCDLIMTDRRKEVIEKKVREVRDKYACKVIVILVGLVSKGGIGKLLAPLEGQEVYVLVNNVGFSFRTSFSDTDIDGLKRLIYLQTMAVTEITHRVLKGMRGRNKGTTINISSGGVFTVVPGNATYATSERFIVTLTGELHMELMGTEIRVQAVRPGFVDTDFHESNRIHVDKTRKSMLGFRQPEDAVNEAMREFERGKVICIPDRAGKLVKAAAEYMPRKIYYRSANDPVSKNIGKN